MDFNVFRQLKSSGTPLLYSISLTAFMYALGGHKQTKRAVSDARINGMIFFEPTGP